MINKIISLAIVLCFVNVSLAQNVGIGTNTPKAVFNVASGKTVLFGSDSSGVGNNSGKLIWYGSKAAFRTGYITGTQWDYNNIGIASIAMGYNTQAIGLASTAFGEGTIAFGFGSTAMGFTTVASGLRSTTAGYYTTAKSFLETTLGSLNTDYTPLSETDWNTSDRLFVLGNGSYVETQPGIHSLIKSDAMVVLKNGNTGIGSSNPTTARLVIGGTNGLEGLDLSSANQYANLRVLRNSLGSIDKDMYIGLQSGLTSSLHLYSNNNETMTIKGNNIGIGENNPAFPLNFYGSLGDKISFYGNAANSSNIGFGIQSGLFQMHSYQASDDIAFGYGSSNNFTEQMRIKGTGNVGIGTSNPATARLVIGGSSTQEGLDLSSADQYANMRVIRNSLGSDDKDLYIGYKSGTTSSLHLYSNNNETMTIKGNSVGIGTTTPKAPFNVASGKTVLFGADTSGTGNKLIWYAGKGAFRVGNPTATSWNYNNVGVASVAIGSNTKASGDNSIAMGYYAFATGGSSTAMGNNTSADGDNSTAMGNYNSAPSFAETVIGSFNTNYIPLSATSWNSADRLFVIGNGTGSSASDAMVVLKNGNTGIGVSNPAYKLHLGNNNNGLRIEGPASTGSGGSALNIGGAGDVVVDAPGIVAGRFIIRENGNIGIGKTTPNTKLDVAGVVNASGGYTQVSDIRYKKNITSLIKPLNNLLLLNGTEYFFKATDFPEMNFSSNKQIGLIAQDVEKIFPELVTTDNNGYKSVNYTGLIPVMIESIKTLQKEIEELKKKIK